MVADFERHRPSALGEIEGGDAVFAIVIVATSKASGVHMDVKGEARIRTRDSRLVGLALDGAYDHDDATKGSFVLRRVIRDL